MKPSLTGIHAGIFNTKGLKDKNEIWANVDDTTTPPKYTNTKKVTKQPSTMSTHPYYQASFVNGRMSLVGFSYAIKQ